MKEFPLFSHKLFIFFIIILSNALTASASNVDGNSSIHISLNALNTATYGKPDLSTYSIVEKNNKKGLADEKGEVVIPASYDDIGWSYGKPKVVDNVIGYKENNYWGLINIKNSRVTAPIYIQITPYVDNLLITAKKLPNANASAYGLINTKGKVVIPFKYHSLQGHESGIIAAIEKNGQIRYGVINTKQKTILSFDYQQITGVSKDYFAVRSESGKVALVDAKGFRIIGFEEGLDSIGKFNGNTALVLKNGKTGLIDNLGKFIVTPEYKEISEETYGYRGIYFPEWKMLHANNNLVKKVHYDELVPVSKGVYKARIGRREALIDENETFLTPLYAAVGDFSERVAYIKKEGKYGVINDAGEVIVRPEYDSIVVNRDLIFALKRMQSDQWVIFNHKGNSLNKTVYQGLSFVREGLVPVKRNNSWGFINGNGQEVIPCQYDSVESFEGEFAKAKYLKSEGVINSKGEWIANPWNEIAQPVSSNSIYFRAGGKSGVLGAGNKYMYTTENVFFPINSGFIEKNNENKLGLINSKGKVILNMEYDEISHLLEDSIYIFRKDNKYGIITKSGKIKVPLTSRFQELHQLSDNYLGVKINDKYGFVDVNGALRISNQYDAIGNYQENLAPIKLRGHWGYIDKIERIIIQPSFDKAFGFSDGLAVVMKNGKYGLVNREGKIVLPMEYDRLEKTDGKKYICYQGNKAGLVGENGRLLIFPKYDDLEDLQNGFVIIKRNGKYGLMTTNGVDTIPLIYDALRYDPINDVYLGTTPSQWENIASK